MNTKQKDDVVIVSGVRTPFSKFGGVLKEIHSTDLGVIVIKESLKRAGIKGEDLDEVFKSHLALILRAWQAAPLPMGEGTT